MNLKLVEVLWKYGMFPAEKLPQIANEHLIKGIYGPATAEIAEMIDPSEAEIGDLFERCVLEINKDFLEEEQMPKIIAKGLLEKLVDPKDGVYILAKLYEELNFPKELKIFHLLNEEYSQYIPPKYIAHLKENPLIPVFIVKCRKDILKSAEDFLKGKNA